jgi:hypothetical protein
VRPLSSQHRVSLSFLTSNAEATPEFPRFLLPVSTHQFLGEP